MHEESPPDADELGVWLDDMAKRKAPEMDICLRMQHTLRCLQQAGKLHRSVHPRAPLIAMHSTILKLPLFNEAHEYWSRRVCLAVYNQWPMPA